MASAPSSTRPIRILALHGYTQSGGLFRLKTRALEKSLNKAFAATGGVEITYITAPLQLRRADIPAAWDVSSRVVAPPPPPPPSSSSGTTTPYTSTTLSSSSSSLPTARRVATPELREQRGNAGASSEQADEEELDCWTWWRRSATADTAQPALYQYMDVGIAPP